MQVRPRACAAKLRPTLRTRVVSDLPQSSLAIRTQSSTISASNLSETRSRAVADDPPSGGSTIGPSDGTSYEVLSRAKTLGLLLCADLMILAFQIRPSFRWRSGSTGSMQMVHSKGSGKSQSKHSTTVGYRSTLPGAFQQMCAGQLAKPFLCSRLAQMKEELAVGLLEVLRDVAHLQDGDVRKLFVAGALQEVG